MPLGALRRVRELGRGGFGRVIEAWRRGKWGSLSWADFVGGVEYHEYVDFFGADWRFRKGNPFMLLEILDLKFLR